MSSEIAININSLSKCYQIYDHPRDRLKQFLIPRFQKFLGLSPRKYYREYWPLKDISFQVKKGETVGIIGRNGSGKSTLLQMICGTLNSTNGTIQTNGRVAALLELGSGFNVEFTGRENIYINASILGLSKKEIDYKFNEIVSFADIGDFIDQPVKTYSSGMSIRLAFSIAASVEPEILVIDEALAVGDIRFQAKCFDRLHFLKATGTTILFVSHATDQIVKHCDRALLIDEGSLIQAGLPKDIVNCFMDLLYGNSEDNQRESGASGSGLLTSNRQTHSEGASRFSINELDEYANRLGWNPNEYRWGNEDAIILDYLILNNHGNHTIQLHSDEQYVIMMKVLLKQGVTNPVFGFYIKTIDGLLLTGSNSRDFPAKEQSSEIVDQVSGMFEVSFNFCPRFESGAYMISLGVAEDVAGTLIPLDRRYDSILVNIVNRNAYFGLVDLDTQCFVNSITNTQKEING